MLHLIAVISPEAANALIIAGVGSVGAFCTSYIAARRQAARDRTSDVTHFRDNILDDNSSLRLELKDAKKERDDLRDECRRLEDVNKERDELRDECRRLEDKLAKQSRDNKPPQV